jgi:hypothetical protein
MVRITFALFCAPVFGLMFIWFGAQRLFGAARSDKPGEAVFWGSFGIVLGIGVITGIVWLLFFAPDVPE